MVVEGLNPWPLRARAHGAGRSRAWSSRLVLVAFGLALVASACSGSEDPQPQAALSPESADTETGAPIGEVVSVSDVAIGTPITDVSGDVVTIHGWADWPDAVDALDPYSNPDIRLFGNVDFNRSARTSFIAVDVEVCASPSQAADLERFDARFQAVTDNGRVRGADRGDLRAVMIFQQVLSPMFVWPASGECARGWQGLEWSIDELAPAQAQYTAISREEETFGDQHVYRWTLGDSVAPQPASGPTYLSAGQPGTFVGGTLEGWQVNVQGWTRVPDTTGELSAAGLPFVPPVGGTSLVAVLLEMCSNGSAGLPALGLQVDGWNLVPQFTRGEPWGVGFTEVTRPAVGDCATGWTAFEAPDGAIPTAVFATDTFDAGSMWFEWSLAGAELDPPQAELGFPGPILVESAIAACEATQPLVVELTAEQAADWQVGPEVSLASAVAVRSASGRVEVFLSGQLLQAVDIPVPSDPATYAVVMAIEDAEAGVIEPGDYRDDFSTPRGATLRVVRGGAEASTVVAGAIVTISSVDDGIICGTVSAEDAAGQRIFGTFGAPIWDLS